MTIIKRSSFAFIFFVALLTCSFFVGISNAATYYVSNSGSNSNSGSILQPWYSLQYAAENVFAGDTVIAAAGTYNEFVSTRRSGAAGSHITFQADSSVYIGGFDIRHSYIRVQGFQVTGTGASGYSGAVNVSSSSSYVEVLGNTIQNTPPNVGGVSFQRGGTLPAASADHVIIRGNTLKNLGFHMIRMHGTNNLIEGNLFEDSNGFDAIRMFGAANTVRGNTFRRIQEVPGNGNHADIIQSFGDNGDEAYDIIFENNFVEDCNPSQIGQVTQDGVANIRHWIFRNNVFTRVFASLNLYAPYMEVTNNTFYRTTQNQGHVVNFSIRSDTNSRGDYGTVKNNIFLESGSDPSSGTKGWYYTAPGLVGFNADYNYVAGTGFSSKSAFNEPNGINGGDPRFSNPAAGDFHIKSDSPAIDAGAAINGFNYDKDGNMRTIIWDIGAYEFVENPPSAPLALKVVSSGS